MPRSSKEITAEIDNLDPTLRLHWLRLDAARGHYGRLSKSALVQLTSLMGGEDLANSDNSIPAVVGFTHTDQAAGLAKVAAVIRVLEDSPLAAEVERVLRPLLVERAEAFDRESTQRHEATLARNAAAEALEAATVKAMAAAEKDPAVKAARAKLEALEGQPDANRELAADFH